MKDNKIIPTITPCGSHEYINFAKKTPQTGFNLLPHSLLLTRDTACFYYLNAILCMYCIPICGQRITGGSVYVYTVYNSATVHAINVEGEDVWTSQLGGGADGGGDAQDGASHLG